MTVAAPSANGASTTSRPAAPRPVQRPPSALELIRSADRTEAAAPTAAPETASAAVSVQLPGFSPEQLAALSAPLDRARISSREQGRGRVNYLQGWVLIEEANRIFGFDGWQRQTLFSRCVTEAKRLIGRKSEGRPQKEGWGVTYIARVRITIHAGAHGPLVREGTGAGHGNRFAEAQGLRRRSRSGP